MRKLETTFKRNEIYLQFVARCSKVAIYECREAPNTVPYAYFVFIIQIGEDSYGKYEFVPADIDRGLKMWSTKTLEQATEKYILVRRNLYHSFHMPNYEKN